MSTFAGHWERAVESHGARPFLRFEASTGKVSEWSYVEFDQLVSRTASTLLRLGVTGDRGVHLALTNSPAFVAAWIATNRLGSFIVPSDPMATSAELAEHIRRTAPAVSIVATARRETADAALALVDGPTPVVLDIDEDDTDLAVFTPEHSPTGTSVDWPEPADGDRAAVMFTSGTTGRPKGVVITQANYAFAGETMAQAAGLGAPDRQLVVLPLFHANAQYYSFASAIAVGASVALMHTFSASRFVEQAARHRATHASLFAGPMRMILARGGPLDGTAAEPLRLRHCWFAQNVTTDQYETLADWFGCHPRQLYGMTETIPAVLTDHAIDPQPDSIGFETAGCNVDIIDADGRSCGPGITGEIVVGGTPGLHLFDGYLDDPVTTAASYRDGWFLTGDRAHRDASGRYRFDGRRSDVLKVAGENVSIVEVEAALAEHPLVFDVVVVGVPDPIRDEVPVAFVIADPSCDLDDDAITAELESWAEERLGKAKRPRRYTFVDEVPRTSVGKVRKFLLTEAAAATMEATPTQPSPLDHPPTSTPQENP